MRFYVLYGVSIILYLIVIYKILKCRRKSEPSALFCHRCNIFYVGFIGNVIVSQVMEVLKAEMQHTPELFMDVLVCRRDS